MISTLSKPGDLMYRFTHQWWEPAIFLGYDGILICSLGADGRVVPSQNYDVYMPAALGES